MTVPQAGVVLEQERQGVAPSLKQSPQRWWLLALLFVVMLIAYAQRGALSVAAPFMSKDLNLTKADIGVLLSAFFWVYSFMQMPAGWLADRLGVRRMYSLGFIFWSLASTLTGLARGFATLIGLRVALGAGQAIAFPASARAVANWFQERERGMVTGLYLVGVRFGTALINALGAYFLATYDWKLFFIVTGLVPLVWVFPWERFLRKWEQGAGSRGARERGSGGAGERRRRGAEAQGSKGDFGSSAPLPLCSSAAQPPISSAPLLPRSSAPLPFLEGLFLLKHRTVLGIFLGFFAYDYAWVVFLTWLPGYLIMERQFTPREMGLYSSVPYLAMSIIILLSGILSDWLVRRGSDETRVRKIFIIVGLAVGCLIVPAGMVADKMTAVWLLTISLCGVGIASPNTWTLTQAVCEKKIVGTVSGIQNFGGNLGGVLAPALTGFIAHATDSFALALGVTGLVLVGGMLAYWFLISEKVEMTGRPS